MTAKQYVKNKYPNARNLRGSRKIDLGYVYYHQIISDVVIEDYIVLGEGYTSPRAWSDAKYKQKIKEIKL